MAILVTGGNTEIEEQNNTITSLQNKLEVFERENKSLREEIIRINLVNVNKNRPTVRSNNTRG